MKYFNALILILSLVFISAGIGDKKFPSAELKDLSGKIVKTDDIIGKNKITVVSFWATWCVPCMRELEIYSEIYDEWKEKYDIQIIAVTIDNTRQLAKVKPLVAQKQWQFTVLSDVNQDLMKALNFTFVPQTFILNNEGNIVFDHSGFKPGDELEMEKIFDELQGK
ncbi:MAG: TlpA family protein disulfide reductase [Deltaproteobacteria bacterium]